LLYGCSRIEEGLYLPFVSQKKTSKSKDRLLGCNMGIYKESLIAINGFDEEYDAPCCGEDSDIEWRLEKLPGITFYSMKFKAIVYHIWHRQGFTEQGAEKNYRIMSDKIKQGLYACKKGIKQI
jgi:hypothetical protein